MRYRLRAATAIAASLCAIPLAAGCGGGATDSATTVSTTTENTLSKGTLDTDNPAPPVTESPGAGSRETTTRTKTSTRTETSTDPETSGGAAPSSTTGSSTAATLPHPCTLLPNSEVTGLTGMSVDTVDNDTDTPELRRCSWHLIADPGDGADFSVSLSPTTPEQFNDQRIDGSSNVRGVGDESVTYQFRLYTRSGSTMIDIYFRRSSVDDTAMGETRKKVATAVIDKITKPN